MKKVEILKKNSFEEKGLCALYSWVEVELKKKQGIKAGTNTKGRSVCVLKRRKVIEEREMLGDIGKGKYVENSCFQPK